MIHRPYAVPGVVAAIATTLFISSPKLRGQEPRLRQIAAVTPAELRTWDSQVDRMIRSRELEMRLDREDTLIAGRRHTRYTQTVNGIPI